MFWSFQRHEDSAPCQFCTTSCYGVPMNPRAVPIMRNRRPRVTVVVRPRRSIRANPRKRISANIFVVRPRTMWAAVAGTLMRCVVAVPPYRTILGHFATTAARAPTATPDSAHRRVGTAARKSPLSRLVARSEQRHWGNLRVSSDGVISGWVRRSLPNSTTQSERKRLAEDHAAPIGEI